MKAATKVEFEGRDIFIFCGTVTHCVYPARPGTYWADMESAPGCESIETGVRILDDFGNLVEGRETARQRADFFQALH